MRKRYRRSRHISVFALTAAVFSWWVVNADLEDGGFQGAFKFVEAGETGSAIFETEDELHQYLVVGFDEEPLLFEVSDALNPRLVNGFEHLTPENAPGAAYFIYDAAGQFVAIDEATIPAVAEIAPAP